jgi:DNA polymerase III epsilon subunit-like protein
MGKLCLYFVDCETTSLDNTKGDIVEISFIRNNDGEQKTWHIKPTNPENIEDSALAVNGISKDDLLWRTDAGKQKFKEVDVVLPDIENWIADDDSNQYDRVLVGHNIQFDYNYMMKAWERAKCIDTFPFSKYGMLIDTKQLALFFDYIKGENNQKYNLGALIKKYGIQKRKCHNAADDIAMTKDMFDMFAKNACKQTINKDDLIFDSSLPKKAG